jgi:phosphoenolpyruvate carboxykinase (GTP)
MVDVHAALGGAGLRNVHVREYVRYWAELTGAARIEVISTSDDARLIGEALADGEILPAGVWGSRTWPPLLTSAFMRPARIR